jgi:uncharacterized protein YndB with AHSA1/START domain
VRPVTLTTSISAPREEVYDFLVDLANRVAYTDHYMKDYRLARANSIGVGAAARFKLDAPISQQWGEIEITQADRPRRIAERGRIGRLGRTPTAAVYELVQDAGDVTRVELTIWTEPATPFDAALERMGARRWITRKNRKALGRLRRIFEEEQDGPPARATIAGYEPLKAPRFG